MAMLEWFMRMISVMSQKGGAGKTTLSVHLAVALEKAGHKTVLLDTDPQQSAMVWAKRRQIETPVVFAISVLQLEQALAVARENLFDFVLVDSAPHGGADAADVARYADQVLIPVRPSIFDIAAIQRTITIVQRINVPATIVLSACPYRAPEIEFARAELAQAGIPVAKSSITDRRAFSRALQTGASVNEFEPHGKAAAEIHKLLEELI